MPTYKTPAKPVVKSKDPSLSASNRELVKEEFSKRLYDAIMQRGWTQSEFARHCDLNRDAISTYVRGRSMPSPQSLEKMAQVLGLNPEDLLPNYYEAGQSAVEPQMELRDVPNEEGYMWLRLNMRLPKKVAIKLFMEAQDHA